MTKRSFFLIILVMVISACLGSNGLGNQPIEIETRKPLSSASTVISSTSTSSTQLTIVTTSSSTTRKEEPTTTITTSTTTTLPSNGYIKYQSNSNGFSIDYPVTWIKQETQEGVIFFSLFEGEDDIFQENLIVLTQDLSFQPMNLSDYTELSIQQIMLIITAANLTESSPTQLGGQNGHRIVYTGRQGMFELKWLELWTIKDDKAFIITFAAGVEKYDDFIAVIEDMIESFEIKNSNPII